MKEEKSNISRLIELKKHEQPEEGFFDDFLQDFQARQRQEIVTVSARSLLKERVATFVRERVLWQWAVGASAVCACAVIGMMAFANEGFTSSTSEVVDVAEPRAIEMSETEMLTLVDPIEVKVNYATEDKVSPLVATVGVEFDFIDLNQENLRENVEF